MRYELFFLSLIDNIGLYILSLLVSIAIYYPIIKRTVLSIIDPMFYALSSCCLANSAAIFLFLINEMSAGFFLHLICSEICFWMGYFFIKNRRVYFSDYQLDDKNIARSLFYIFLSLMILGNIITYYLIGIPLLMSSRLEVYSSGGGIGALSYITNFSTFYCCIYVFIFISNKKYFIAIFSLISILIFSILSGSKSGILVLLYSYFFYRFFYLKQKFNTKQIIKYIPLIVAFPIIILLMKYDGDFLKSTIGLAQRIVAYGDCYWFAYPNNVIENVHIESPFKYLFSPFLGPLRIIDYSEVDKNLGLQLISLVYDYESSWGPNSRLSVLNWCLFKWYGLIMCLLLGVFVGYFTTRIINILPHSIISVIIYGFIYTKIMTVITDPIYGLSHIIPIIMFLFIIWFIFIITGHRFIILKKIRT